MATVNHQGLTRPRRRKRQRIAVALLLVAGLILAIFWTRLQARAALGAAYGARIGCTCRLIENRSLKDCRKDFEPGMSLVLLSEDAPARSVTAQVPLLARQTARLRDGFGCVLQEWTP